MPAAVVILVVVFSVVLVATRYVAVASMACAVALPVVTHLGARFHGRWADGTWNRPLLIFTIVIAVLAIWKHRTNIRRLLDGNEAKFAWRGGQRTTKLDP